MGAHERIAAGGGFDVSVTTGAGDGRLTVSPLCNPENSPPPNEPRTQEPGRSFDLLEKVLTLSTAVLCPRVDDSGVSGQELLRRKP
jgi:hypothetical protein